MINLDNVSLYFNNLALKNILDGNISDTIPATSGGAGSQEYVRLTIPHGYDSDELLFRVMISIPGATGFTDPTVAPFDYSGGGFGGLFCTPSIDDTNLYVEVGQSGISLAAQPFTIYYKVFVP